MRKLDAGVVAAECAGETSRWLGPIPMTSAGIGGPPECGGTHPTVIHGRARAMYLGRDCFLFRCRIEPPSRVAVMGSISKKMAWLCLLLMLSSAIATVAHHHSDANESARCTVCVAAHSTAPTTPVLPPRVTFVAVSTLRAEPDLTPRQRLITFALLVRPPPQS
jgi:hypothetical protein